jgi:hypothetical protein
MHSFLKEHRPTFLVLLKGFVLFLSQICNKASELHQNPSAATVKASVVRRRPAFV